MTVSEIVDELRATRPRAGEPLRLQVLTLASRPVPAESPTRERLRRHRRLTLLVPVAAGLAVATAVAIGITRPDPVAREATPPSAAQRATDQKGAEATFAGPPADASVSTEPRTAPGPVTGRAQRYTANLTLAVEDTDALSQATQRALTIARDLGGYVVSVQYATADDGTASVTLRVPSARAGDAVTRLSELGTILAQDVQIQDLQESLDTFDRELARLQARIAALSAALDRAESAAERARLLEQRAQAQAELRELRSSRSVTAAEARNATIQLELRTEETGVAAPGSRLDRALDNALAVLAWEAVVVLAIGVALAPLALLLAAVWATRRVRRHREDERLLAAS
jgi:Domain of unknown function (DUF4349)